VELTRFQTVKEEEEEDCAEELKIARFLIEEK